MSLKSKSLFILLFFLFALISGQPAGSSESGTVRLALVNVPDELLKPLLPEFQKETGLKAEIIYTGSDPFALGREGKADMVISHYGHEGAAPFVTAGFGLWPHPVFANQMALLGPAGDPAKIRGLTDAAEAFRRIAAGKFPFLTNNGAGSRYLEQILWASAGVREKGSWYLDLKSEGEEGRSGRRAEECICSLGAVAVFEAEAPGSDRSHAPGCGRPHLSAYYGFHNCKSQEGDGR